MTEHVIRVAFPHDAPLKLLNNYGFNLTEDSDRDMLEQEIEDTGAVMVIIDPVYLVMGDLNLNESHRVGPVLQWLMALRHNHDCAVVLVHHWSKVSEFSVQRRSGQRLMGSTFFHGWLESGLYMEKLEAEGGPMSVKVEREFRNAPPMSDLAVDWSFGEPGELDMKIESTDLTREDTIRRTIEQLARSDRVDKAYGNLNVKHLVSEMGWSKTKESRERARDAAQAAGYDIQSKKYPNGMGYFIVLNGDNSG